MIQTLAAEPRGIVLLTGTTGSGKSTTLAAMVDHINSTQARHIITLEDPIEYLHRDKTSIVNQREIGQDTESFGRAMRRVLRQDPDVILIGEMRDEETVRTALSAAETGHLVLSTLHTLDATETQETGRLTELIAEGEYYGMQTYDQALLHHVMAGNVDHDVAFEAASSPHDFKLMLEARGQRSSGIEQVMNEEPEPAAAPLGLG